MPIESALSKVLGTAIAMGDLSLRAERLDLCPSKKEIRMTSGERGDRIGQVCNRIWVCRKGLMYGPKS